MPFERFGPTSRRIAVIGGGISGLAAAWLLSTDHAVTLYEAEPRLGGHARTVLAGKRGDQPVDTGFIVYNRANYPHLSRLFDALEVPVAPSSMSFAASFGGGALEYGLGSPGQVFAQWRNAADPRYLRMIADILRFNRRAEATVRPGMTIGGLLAALGTGPWFRDRYLGPFSGAIWSTPPAGMLDFPADTLVAFFRNHALLGYTGQHQWYTVRGGSVEYVRRLTARLEAQEVELRTGAPVAGVRRDAAGAQVRAEGGDWEGYDEVILATHSDVSLRLLSDATPDERAALAAVRYQPNVAVLHADPALMPRRRKVWSSWNYVEPAGGADGRPIALTYWMNELQPIPKDDPLFVTLNATAPIRDELVHDTVTFHHPVYDTAAARGRAAVQAMNGTRATWFCGAWMRNGFHEDGFASAVDVADALRARTGAMQAAE